MNTKFFKYIIPALSLVFSVNFTSCLGDLDVTPIDPNLNVEFDQNANFAKIYAGLAITGNKGPDGQGDIADTDEGASGLMRMLFNLNELPTDEAICAWSGDVDVYPLNFAKFTASNGVVLNMFNRLYIQIAQCNNFLIQTEGKDDEESLTQRAEVRFIRALDYYYLIDLYGNVPFVDENTGIGTYVPERITRANLYTYIEKELKEIEPQMKAPRANVYGRADQAAVWMLLSRLYLNAEVYTGDPQWNACIQECDDIINSGKYSLDINYSDPFKAHNENSLENILVIPYDEIFATGFNYHLAALHGANQKTYDLVGSPWGAGAYKGIPQFIDTYDPDDERLNATWLGGPQYASDGTPLTGSYDLMGQPLIFVNKMPNGIFTGEAEGYRWLKYEVEMGARSELNNDLVLFRLTQVHMMKAECLLRTGKADQAASIVSMVRKRAFKEHPEKAIVSGAQLQEKSCYKYGTVENYVLTSQNQVYPEKFGRFYDELGWEFAGESYRRRDMIRFGHFTKAKWLSHEPNGDYKTVFPLPQKVVDTNPNLEQNPNYQ